MSPPPCSIPCVSGCVDSGIEHVRDGVLRCKYSGTTSVRPKTDSGGAGSDFVVSVFYGSDPLMPNTETLIKSPQVGVMITRFLWVRLRYADDRTPCHKL